MTRCPTGYKKQKGLREKDTKCVHKKTGAPVGAKAYVGPKRKPPAPPRAKDIKALGPLTGGHKWDSGLPMPGQAPKYRIRKKR